MRKASRRGRKRRCAAHRCEPGAVESRVAARTVECLMREVAELIDEETNLPDENEMLSPDSWRETQLAADQSHEQRLVACLLGSAADRCRFSMGANGVGGRRSQGGELLRDGHLLTLRGRVLARLLLWF